MDGFSTALSGMQAESAALNIVGNNLANLNTTGYKGSTANFYDLVNESINATDPNSGTGVTAPQAIRSFTQGSIQVTSGQYDAAIQGSGLFVLQNSQGNTLYTRAGNFQLNAQGQLVTSTGEAVQGWTADANGVVSASGAVGNIVVPPGSLQTPAASTQFTVNANLNAAGTVGGTDGTFSTPVSVVDSLGEKHTLTVTFTKTANNAWSYNVTIPGEDLSSGTAGTPSNVAKGSLTFDSSGNLLTPAAPGSVAISITGLADGAANLAPNWTLYDASSNPTLTQFSQTSSTSGNTADGVASAQLTSVGMQNGGLLVAKYSDGSSRTVAELAVAGFSNPESLVAVGNNNFQVSADTSAASVGAAGTGGRGQIEGGALESSNVDIASEFTNLIVFQRSYQADSRVITTLDQMSQALMQLGR